MFELMSQHRTVYAIDLPGYGTSERSDRLYTPRLMTDAILDLSTSYGQKTRPSQFPDQSRPVNSHCCQPSAKPLNPALAATAPGEHDKHPALGRHALIQHTARASRFDFLTIRDK